MKKKNGRFDVYTPTRTWYFKCDDPVELESWVDTINANIKKNFFWLKEYRYYIFNTSHHHGFDSMRYVDAYNI